MKVYNLLFLLLLYGQKLRLQYQKEVLVQNMHIPQKYQRDYEQVLPHIWHLQDLPFLFQYDEQLQIKMETDYF